MAKQKSLEKHKIELIGVALFLAIIMVAYSVKDSLNDTHVWISISVYFILNVLYSAWAGSLNTSRIAEISLLSAIGLYVALSFI